LPDGGGGKMLDSRRWTVAVLVALLVVGPVAATLPADALSSPNSNSTDIDIAFKDSNSNLKYVDDNGNTVDTGTDAKGVGGVADIDGDGDLDIAFRDSNNNVKYVDDSGTIVDTGADAFEVGGVADIDGDGDLDIAFSDTSNNNLKYVDDNGNTVDTGADAFGVGGVADIDGDGDLDIAFRDSANNLKYVDDNGNVVDTGTDAFGVGGVADIDGDGDLDIAFSDTSNDNVKYVDDSGNTVDTGADAFGVGGVADIDGDGDLDIAFSDTSNNNLKYVDDSGNTVDTGADANSVGGVADIDGDGLFFDPPTVDNSTADPAGGVRVTSSPVTLEIDVKDTEFSAGDTVAVEFINNGQTVGTDTLTTNRTASVSTSTIQAGTNEWYVKASDATGNSQRSQNFTFEAPNEIQVRNASAPGQLVTGTSNEITVRFFDTGKDVIKKNTTTGTLSMSGLPAAPEGGYVISVKDGSAFNDRRVIIDSLFRQQTVYLLPSGASSSEVEFEIDDRTGNFKQPELFIERPFSRDFDGDGANETRYDRAFADDFDAAGTITAVLENEVRYRLRLRNADGDERVLGSITPTRARVVTLTVGKLEFNPRQPQDRTFNATASTIETQNGTVSDVRFDYRDPTNETSKINVTVRTLNGTVLGSASTANGPFGDFSFTQPVQDPANETYVVEFSATRNGEVVSGQLRPGIAKLPVGIPLKDGLKSLFAVGMLLLVGGLFSASNARVGAVVTPLFAAGLWFIDWLPGAVSIFAVVIALAVGVLFNYARRTP
jgi:hypothetical protein